MVCLATLLLREARSLGKNTDFSRYVHAHIIMGDGCGGNYAATGVLLSVVPLFNIVEQILQQKLVQDKLCVGKKKDMNCILLSELNCRSCNC